MANSELTFPVPPITSKGEGVPTFVGALEYLFKCGCSISCCYGALSLWDYTTGETTYIYVDGGVLMTTTDKSVLKKRTDV